MSEVNSLVKKNMTYQCTKKHSTCRNQCLKNKNILNKVYITKQFNSFLFCRLFSFYNNKEKYVHKKFSNNNLTSFNLRNKVIL